MRLIGLAIVLALGLTVAPLAVQARQTGNVARIGILRPGPCGEPDQRRASGIWRVLLYHRDIQPFNEDGNYSRALTVIK